MGIYVASRAIPDRVAMWHDFRSQGYPIISTWIDEAGLGETKDQAELWRRVSTEIGSAAGLVLYAEPIDFPLKGALIEAGMALGRGLKVFTVLPGVVLETPSLRPIGSWVRHPHVRRVGTVEIAFRRIVG